MSFIGSKCKIQKIGLSFQNEVRVLKRLGRHLHVIKMVGCDANRELIALEFCQQGNLRRYLQLNRTSFIDEVMSCH